MRQDIKELNREALLGWLALQGVRAFRADQIFKWIYLRLIDDFEQMTDLRKELRQLL